MTIDDEVLRAAKQKAAEQNLTLSQLVERALRDALRPAPPPEARYTVPTFGRGPTRAGPTPAEVANMMAEQDGAGLTGRADSC